MKLFAFVTLQFLNLQLNRNIGCIEIQEFAQISPYTIEELIKYPFNGANFSSRLWKQKDYMLTQLTESITTMIIQGKNPNTLSKDFAKKFGTKEHETYRLFHTAGSFIMEQAILTGYAEDGVTKY